VKQKIILVPVVLVLVGLIFVACTGGAPVELVPSPEPTAMGTAPPIEEDESEYDFSAVKARISGSWGIAYGNSRITISENSQFEASWDNMTIINGQFTISRENETDYRLTLTPERVRTLSANQPEFGSPQFDDEQYNSSPSWAQRDIIVNPSNQNRLGLVGYDGTVEWVDIYFDSEVLWLEDRI